MRKLRWGAICLALAVATCMAGGPSRQKRLERLKTLAAVEQDVMVPMRDGVRLATDVARPKGESKHPAVLMRTPYRKNILGAMGYVRAGYALVAQDCRGRYGSEGEHYPFRDDIDDGADTVAWVARQPWCDGNVGMVGGSYVGYTQLAAAMARAPKLRCILPTVPPSDFVNGLLYCGGTLRMELVQGWLLGHSWKGKRVLEKRVPAAELARWRPQRNFRKWCWHLPLADPGPIAVGGDSYAQCWRDIVASWERPATWRPMSATLRAEDIAVPTCIIAGFYDIFAQDNIDLLLALRARGGTKATRAHSHLLIGPWVHGVGRAAGDVNFVKAHAALRDIRQKWFARWLKDTPNDVDNWPPIRAFVMGQDRWIDTDTWPPRQSVPTKFYLANGVLAPTPPSQPQAPTTFTYDPANPVPTLGGTNLVVAKGIRDHRRHAQRPDVLAFATEPLDRDLVVVGPLRAHLFVSTSAPDTDFTAMLLDVRPDGYKANIQDGIVRLRYRNGRDKPQLAKPGDTVEVDIDLWSTAYTFKAGHRIALHVSSSNFPRFDRNLNIAESPATWTTPQKAENKVYHDPAHASYIELPVFPTRTD